MSGNKDSASNADNLSQSQARDPAPTEDLLMNYDDAPEHVRLAVEMIRQMENLQFEEETVLEASLLVIQDTLNKLKDTDRMRWKNRLGAVLNLPGQRSPVRQTSA